MGAVAEVVFVLIILGMTYALSSEGLWGAALMFFNVLFAGLIAFNFYEPLALLLSEYVPAYADTTCFLALLIVSLVILRVATESLAPGMVRFPTAVYHAGRFVFALAASLLTVGLILIAFHTSPVHKKMFGAIDYDRQPPFGLALDRRWLAFFQFTSGQVFATYGSDVRDPEYDDAKVFDPKGSWLIDHQNARPYGDPSDNVPPDAGGEAAAEGGAEGSGGGSGVAPGGAQGGQQGPGIPGGTAGAAAGLAPTNP